MRKEIEVKARVSDKGTLVQALRNVGCNLSEPVIQEDAVFVNFDHAFDAHLPGNQYLRIRKAAGKILFTVKEPLSNDLDSIEHEVEVNDALELKEILEMLGYRQEIEIRKSRQKAQYGEYEICVDEVDVLGFFIEVEKITDEADSEKVQGELFDFLMTLGIKKEDRVMQGYDTLLYLKNKE